MPLRMPKWRKSIKDTFENIKSFDYLDFIKGIRVEPIVFLMQLAKGLSGLVYTIAIYQIICQHTIGLDNEYLNCLNPSLSTSYHNHSNYTNDFAQHALDVRKQVKKANTFWRKTLPIIYDILAIFGDSLFAALGDRLGRKISILVGLVGFIICLYPYVALFTFPEMPFYVLVIANVIASLTGYQSVIDISLYAYLADTIADKRNLAIRMGFIVTANYASGLLTPTLSNLMMKKFTYAQCYLVTVCLYGVAFFLSLVLFEQVPPKIMRKIALKKYIEKHGHPPEGVTEAELEGINYKKLDGKIEMVDAQKGQEHEHQLHDVDLNDEKLSQKQHYDTDRDTNAHSVTTSENANSSGHTVTTTNGSGRTVTAANGKTSLWKDFMALLRNTSTLAKDMYKTWKRPRPHRGRIYLLIVSLVYLLQMIIESGDVTLLYIQKSPFFWGPDQWSYYRTFSSALQFAVSLVGISFFKKLLHMRDTSIVLIIMSAQVVQMFITAFAKHSYELYIAVAIGCMFDLFVPCLKSFMAQLVEPNEVGKVYSVFGMATIIKLSGLMYMGIYLATITYFPGFVYVLKGCLYLICIVTMLWLHFDYKRHHK